MGAASLLTVLWPCTTSLFLLHIATITTGSVLYLPAEDSMDNTYSNLRCVLFLSVHTVTGSRQRFSQPVLWEKFPNICSPVYLISRKYVINLCWHKFRQNFLSKWEQSVVTWQVLWSILPESFAGSLQQWKNILQCILYSLYSTVCIVCTLCKISDH